MLNLSWVQRIGAGLSCLGIAFMAYLSYVHFAPTGTSTFCDFAPGFSCEIVNKSAFAEVMGVPVAVLGLLYFILLSVFFLFSFSQTKMLLWLPYFTIFSLVFSGYLSWVEVRLLGTLCLFCELSKVTMFGILALLMIEAPKRDQRISYPMLAASLVIGGIFVTVAYTTAL